MEIVDFAPLGFSDPTDGEAFIVSVFRRSHYLCANYKYTEALFAKVLKNKRSYNDIKSFLYFLMLNIKYICRIKYYINIFIYING